MTSFWFAAAPSPQAISLNPTCEYRAVVVDGELLWAVVQEPVEPQQLRRAVEWELMPETLLRDLEMALSKPNVASPPVLLKGANLDLPFNVQGYTLDAHIGHVTVARQLLLAYCISFDGVDAEVAVAGERWLLSVHPADAVAELIEWTASTRT